ncbi:MAG: hypothetical protein AB1552_11580 [Nitrospirota bacterium]
MKIIGVVCKGSGGICCRTNSKQILQNSPTTSKYIRTHALEIQQIREKYQEAHEVEIRYQNEETYTAREDKAFRFKLFLTPAREHCPLLQIIKHY